MKFATINGYTHTPGAPEGWDPAKYDGGCGALPIRVEIPGRNVARGEPVARGEAIRCKSAWKPTFEEILMLIGGGYVELTVAGWQVPVAIKTIEKHEAME